MKLFLLGLLLTGSKGASPLYDKYRQSLDSAEKSEVITSQILCRWEHSTPSEYQGYLAMVYMLKSNHSRFPFTKLKYFNKGRRILDQAILQNPMNIEYILFRREIQKRIPRILGYNNLEEDKERLAQYIMVTSHKTKDHSLYQKILESLGK